jgi:hypothetical protein
MPLEYRGHAGIGVDSLKRRVKRRPLLADMRPRTGPTRHHYRKEVQRRTWLHVSAALIAAEPEPLAP